MGAAKTPKVPDPAKTYAEGVQTQLQYAPQFAALEQSLRTQYDPQDVAANLARQQQFGPQAIGMYQSALGQIDPSGQAVRAQLGADVSSDLAKGGKLSDAMARQEDQSIRAGQAARGNTLGNSAISAEALNRGAASQALYQQRLNNASSFLSGDNTTQQLTSVAGLDTAATTPDRGFNYVNPNAGTQSQQTALGYYSAALQAGQASASANPWTALLGGAGGSALGALAGGALGSIIPGVGTSIGAGLGAGLGGKIGGVAGSYFGG